MGKGKRDRAEREARQLAHQHTQFVEGQWLGEMAADENPVAKELIRRYNEAASDLRACPHLQKEWDQVRFWVEAVPDRLACKNCTPIVAAEEQKRRNSRCLMCRKHVALRGVSVATGGLLLRGGVCEECQSQLSPQLGT